MYPALKGTGTTLKLFGDSMVSHNITPPSLSRILDIAANFDDTVFVKLEELLKDPATIDPSDSDFSRLSQETRVPDDDLRYFMSLITFLYSKLDQSDPQKTVPILKDFIAESSDLEDASSLAKKMGGLLQYRDAYDAAIKHARLSQGFLPFVLEASSFVDLRTDFERDSNNKLTGNANSRIPVVQLMLRTDSLKENERHIVLQLDKSGVELLQAAIDEINHKIRILDSEG